MGVQYAVRNIDLTSVNKEDFLSFFENLAVRLQDCYSSCLSKNENDFLMWSHYADSHQGMIIEFSLKESPFKENTPRAINYDSSRTNLGLDKIQNEKIMDFICNGLLAKHKRWKYEREYRFLYDIQAHKDDIIW